MNDKRWFIGLIIITLICVSSNVYSADKIYTTDFSLTENPISESGNWIMGGKTIGFDWSDVKTTYGNASGTAASNFTTQWNDAIALLAGTWGADQSVEGVIHLANNDGGGISGFDGNEYGDCNKEVSLLLRGNVAYQDARLYMITFSSRKGNYAYYESGVWHGGPRGYNGMTDPNAAGFYSLNHINGADYQVYDGDTVKATITGYILNVYLRGALIDTIDVRYDVNDVAEAALTTGRPGIGFFSGSGCTGTIHNGDFGLTSIKATAPEIIKAPGSPSIISIR